MRSEAQRESFLEWAVASRAASSELPSGDLHVVQRCNKGMLISVLDGLGHGPAALEAAATAANVLRKTPSKTLIPLVKDCHEALRGTRGVVMSIARLDAIESTITWLGVGNVEGQLLRSTPSAGYSTEAIILRGGLVGYQLPSLVATMVPVVAGDLLIFGTDGLEAGFYESVNLKDAPLRNARRVLERHCKGTDDALVLIARYLGTAHE